MNFAFFCVANFALGDILFKDSKVVSMKRFNNGNFVWVHAKARGK
jgi:hypothetical protein